MNEERAKFLKEDFIQGFPAYLGFQANRIEEGLFESSLRIRTEHQQQDGFVHAGVIATMADHTAGYSAYTIVPENLRILTIEFKINYFKPVRGNEIICKSKVINAGKRIIVSESELYEVSDMEKKMVSKAHVTLAAVPFST